MAHLKLNTMAVLLVACFTSAAPCSAENDLPEGDALMVIPAAGGAPRKLVALRGMHCGTPRWSPDGKWIAFSTEKVPDEGKGSDEERRVFVIPAEGGEPTALTQGSHPAWSPDSQMLAWNIDEVDEWNHGAVLVADFDPVSVGLMGAERVSTGYSVTWFEGDQMYICKPGLQRFDVVTGKDSRNSNPFVSAKTGYGVSPDGRRIVYVVSVPGQYLVISSAEASRSSSAKSFQLARLKTGETLSPNWSRDGKLIAAAWRSSEKGHYQLVTLSPNGKDLPQLIAGQDLNHWNIEPAWSPDGKHLVYRQVDMDLGPYNLGMRERGVDR